MRLSSSSYRLGALVVALAGVAVASCYAAPDPKEAAPTGPGPSPLRRLTNTEYLNALQDTFPGVVLGGALPALPADGLVAGFDNAAEAQEPSDVRIARYEAIANLYAEAATRDTAAVLALTGCADIAGTESRKACASSFIGAMGGRLFRRPVTTAERDRFALRFQAFEAAIDFEGAVRLTLSAMLQSPQFLYRPEPAPATREVPAGVVVPVEPYAMASRLSFFLWQSVPDAALLDAAAKNELSTVAQLRDQANRMLADDRARRVYWGFHRQWLGLDRILGDEHTERTPAVDGAWTTATQASAAKESQLFVENVLMGGGTFRDLFTSRRAFVDAEMARIYGVTLASDAVAWSEVTLPETERAGLLTRASFLAALSHRGATSPPIRGNALQLRVLCKLPAPPPANADLTPPRATPDSGPQTNRMLFEARTAPSACQACHLNLNGFGFGFETYNAAAHYQRTDNGLAVDATGAIHGTDVNAPFDGAVDLSERLSASADVHQCATSQWVRYALGRETTDAEARLVGELSKQFYASGGDVRALLVGIVTAPSFRLRRVEGN